MALEITTEQQKLFSYLEKNPDPIEIQELSKAVEIPQSMVMGTMTFAKEQGWVEIIETTREELIATPDAPQILAKGLPERQFLGVLNDQEKLPMRQVAEEAQKREIKVNEIIKWGTMRKWFEKNGGELCITNRGKEALDKKADDEQAVEIVIEKGNSFLDELPENLDREYVLNLLNKRSELIKLKKRTMRHVQLSADGKKTIPELKVKEEEKTILSSEDIVTGNWRKIKLRPYDITLQAEPKIPVKCHPLQKIVQEARHTFLEMGFTEVVSPHLELGFWDFDALFQPQDHPSRDMQDTFYMQTPLQGNLPEEALVNQVADTHEKGGTTGSSGWGYKWDSEEARRMVLRTHTTATTIRALADDPKPPRKVFCVGRVFRNETISFKHLPEFHQVDGIVIDKNASFCALLGILQAFYQKMGFPKVKFKPAFFPYTEPSAEVFVWMEQKKCWIELGGSGLFRPEVTQPLGCNVPVMAWGLGLERLAMQRYGISDIRTLYASDLDWLQEVRLCQ